MSVFTKKKQITVPENIINKPRHIGIIMDGNGRWAKKRNLPRMAGHKEGAETFKHIAEYLIDLDIEYSTFYAFSTENWKRPKEEVNNLMSLLMDYLEEWQTVRKDKNMHLRFIGDRTPFSDKMRKLMDKIEKESACYKNNLNLALNYGSRSEIVRACNSIIKDGKEFVTEDDFENYLYTKNEPNVDLIIRTGGEKRLSNFLMWQSSYAELYFTDTLWPDMKEKDIDDAINFYSQRDRRFGSVK